MKEHRKVSLETAIDNESLEITFLKNGNVSVEIQTYDGKTDSFISKHVEVPKREWDQFCDLIGNESSSTRKCSRCGQEGHNVRSCTFGETSKQDQ